MNGLSTEMAEAISKRLKKEPLSNHYDVQKELARGKFATVKLCKCKETGKDYAAKFLRKRRKGKDCKNEILHEIMMLEIALKHPRLVSIIDVYETNHDIAIVTDYAPGGELFHEIIMNDCFKEKVVIRLMRQILDGLVFLHNRNIVHLDIKPQNILLTKNYPEGDIKLCDFGFARLINSQEDIRDIIGTPDYVAPEVLSYEPIKTTADMWSLGVLCYVMLTGHSPFAGETKQETFFNISQVNLDFPEDLFCDVSNEAQDFIRKLIVFEPSERMTCQDCLLHPWLRSDDSCLSSTRSPFGSPLGTRRAHSPTEKLIGDTAPVKKYKFADLNLLNLEGRLNTQLEDCTNKNRSSAACSSITKLA